MKTYIIITCVLVLAFLNYFEIQLNPFRITFTGKWLEILGYFCYIVGFVLILASTSNEAQIDILEEINEDLNQELAELEFERQAEEYAQSQRLENDSTPAKNAGNAD